MDLDGIIGKLTIENCNCNSEFFFNRKDKKAIKDVS